jgi:Cu(I)/Ag(I) efflux system membrane fusion protein
MKTKNLRNRIIGLLLVAFTYALWVNIGKEAPQESLAPHSGHSTGEMASVSDLDNETMVMVNALFESYESTRSALAGDDLTGANSGGEALAGVLSGFGQSELPHLVDLNMAAHRIHGAADMDSARLAFGEISEALIETMVNNESLQEGRTLFFCPMVPDGFPNWVQPTDQLDNPYMGLAMPRCGNSEQWPEPVSEEASAIAYYTCPMHTSVRSDDMGTCPICGMDLVPVSEASLLSGEVVIDGQRRQTFGVRTTVIHTGPMIETLRLPARVEWDPSTTHEVNIRADGWVEGLRVNDVGESVQAGQTLFSLYSPALISAQGELLAAINTHGPEHPVTRASKSRLQVLGLTERDLASIIQAGEPSQRLNIRAPQSGIVTQVNLTEGAHVKAGMAAVVISQTSTAVIEADLYEDQLADISAGTEALVSFPALHIPPTPAVVERVDPWLDPLTHTARARMLIENSNGALVAGMDANVELQIDHGESLLLPASAVIFNGDARIVFLDIGEGRLTPTLVTLGVRSNDLYQVLDGLEPGDEVVTSGTFLVAAESRIYSTSAMWEGGSNE